MACSSRNGQSSFSTARHSSSCLLQSNQEEQYAASQVEPPAHAMQGLRPQCAPGSLSFAWPVMMYRGTCLIRGPPPGMLCWLAQRRALHQQLQPMNCLLPGISGLVCKCMQELWTACCAARAPFPLAYAGFHHFRSKARSGHPLS